MTDEQFEKLAPHLVEVSSFANDLNYVKCPRCWHYTHTGLHNHDNLCDRCCLVMIEAWPDHPATPLIKQNLEHQRQTYNI